MGIAREKKKKTLKAKMLGILTMCAMTSLLAAVIVSYMELRMIQNDSIEDPSSSRYLVIVVDW